MTEFREWMMSARLAAGEAQVWRVDAAAGAHDGWRLLVADEVKRARGLRVSVARNEFVAGRAALRVLLGRELGCSALEVRLSAGPQGKPAVAGIEFNVAHSGGVVMIALSRAGAVGIDVEREDRTVEAVEIARSSFHAEELRGIEEAAEGQRAAVFFRCWTRKEAVAKADGRGLSLPLNEFSVWAWGEAGEVPVVLADRDGKDRSYFVRELDAGEGMACSLAFARPAVPVMMHEFPASNEVHQPANLWAIARSGETPGRVTT